MLLKYLIRLLMIAGCVGLIYGFLMVPYFIKKNKPEEQCLHIYTWANRIDESVLQDFQNKTGTKIYLNYYESVEELLTKLEVMPHIDCDLVLPSSYVTQRMIDANLIKPIDIARCSFIEKIYPVFFDIANPTEQLICIAVVLGCVWYWIQCKKN